MWQPSNRQWWILVVVALLIVAVWPGADDKSLALKFTNWAVDPNNQLPTLPGQLAMGQDDDADAVFAHDMQTQYYDLLQTKAAGRGNVWSSRSRTSRSARRPSVRFLPPLA